MNMLVKGGVMIIGGPASGDIKFRLSCALLIVV